MVCCQRLPQRWLLRWQSRQPGSLAGAAGRSLGVELFPGFAAAEVLYDENGAVKGVATGNMGVGRDGKPTASFQPGVELHGKYTLFAEGARGNLGKQLLARFQLMEGRDPQTWGIGIKEIWQVPAAQFKDGLVIHSAGWPLDPATYGGGWMYHFGENLVSVGLVVGLGYRNPYLAPFEEFQRYKTHPTIRAFLEGGKRCRLRLPRDQRKRTAVSAQARISRWRTDWLRRRISQRATHQGQPRGDQERHAGRRRCRSMPWRPNARTTS